MYLSCLEIDTSQPRGRRWLGDVYRVHQRLRLAFGDEVGGRLLFRVEDSPADSEPPADGRDRPSRVLVLAPVRADWRQGFADHPVLLSARQKEVSYALAPGQRLRFVLRANPTIRRVGRHRTNETDGKPADGKREGVLGEEAQLAWLARKGEQSGFAVKQATVRDLGFVKVNRPSGQSQTHLAVEYSGVLQVTDPSALAAAAEAGLGTGKGFGFGLLMLAPAE